MAPSPTWSALECQAFDRHLQDDIGLPAAILMENAACALARHIAGVARQLSGGRILYLVGPGNNGGDAAAAARQLHQEFAGTLWAPLGAPQRAGQPGTAAWDGALELGVPTLAGDCPAERLPAFDLIVDGLFGVGLGRPVAGRAATVLDELAGRATPSIAVDLPSGMDADHGHALGAVLPAHSTVTFVAAKHGFRSEIGASLAGQVEVAGIGVSAAYAASWLAGFRAAS